MADWDPAGDPVPLTPKERWEASGPPAPISSTPEQSYEAGVAKLPRALQNFAPSTMGQAGFAAGAGVAGLGAILAPETFGASMVLGLPLMGSMMGGALQDPKRPFTGASWETAKALGIEALGGILTKGTELASRFAFKNRMLNQTAKRIGGGLTQLFSSYPLKAPQSAKELEDQIPSGQLTDAIGQKLGKFRDGLRKMIAEYTPGSQPQLVPASSGVPFHYTPGKPPSGVKFTLPDFTADGKIISKDLSIGDAIDHVRSLQAAGWSTAGSPKSAQEAWLARQTAHDARTQLINQLNSKQKGLGDVYGELSGDYGAAVHVQKIFKQSYRADRQIDQAEVLKQVRNEIDDIAKFKGQDRALGFRLSVAPTGAEAIPETSMAGHLHGGMEGMRGRFRIPHPYHPEDIRMLPQPFRALSSKQAIPIVGLAAERGGEDIMGE